jgi:DNA-binding protein HU-beta
MNKTALVSAMAENSGMTKKDTDRVLGALVEVITEELSKGGKVQIVGFGAFDVAKRQAREGRNPSTGEPMNIPASIAARFKAGMTLKNAVNSK